MKYKELSVYVNTHTYIYIYSHTNNVFCLFVDFFKD